MVSFPSLVAFKLETDLLSPPFAGETYKQGPFTSSEDQLIKATVEDFRVRSGLSAGDLVKQICTPSKAPSVTHEPSTSSSSSSSTDKQPLRELWLDLGLA